MKLAKYQFKLGHFLGQSRKSPDINLGQKIVGHIGKKVKVISFFELGHKFSD